MDAVLYRITEDIIKYYHAQDKKLNFHSNLFRISDKIIKFSGSPIFFTTWFYSKIYNGYKFYLDPDIELPKDLSERIEHERLILEAIGYILIKHKQYEINFEPVSFNEKVFNENLITNWRFDSTKNKWWYYGKNK